LESRNLGEMQRVYELDIYKPAEGYEGQISNFYFPISAFRERSLLS